MKPSYSPRGRQKVNSKHASHVEWRYHLSFSVDIDVTLVLSRLVFGAAADGSSSELPEHDLRFSAQLFSQGEPLHKVPISSSPCPRVDGKMGSGEGRQTVLSWDEILSFPVQYCDLAANSCLVLTAWTSSGAALGGTALRLFDDYGMLKSGRQRLVFVVGGEGDGQLNSSTPGESSSLTDGDYLFQLAKARQAFEAGPDTRIKWLDRMLLSRADQVQFEAEGRGGASNISAAAVPATTSPATAPDTWSSVFVDVELPVFPFPVLHEERRYQQRAIEAASFGDSHEAVRSSARYPTPTPLLSKRIMSSDRLSATHTPALKSFASSESTSSGAAGGGGVDGVVEKGAAADDVGGGGGFQTMPTTWVSAADPAWNSASVVMVYDSELDASNPVEDMNRMLMHDILRGQMDPDLKPNTSQKEQIEEILNSPKDELTNLQKDLLWMFGYTLLSKPNSVVRFVLAVYWDNIHEVNTATKLLAEWQQPDMAYALRLLSQEKEFQHPVVRSFAVRRLEQAHDEELEMYLLQLVAALRYEPTFDQQSPDGPSPASSASPSSAPRATNKPASPPSRGTSPSRGGSGGGDGSKLNLSPLAEFLVRRARECAPPYALANFLYWFIKVEAESDPVHGATYSTVLQHFLDTLPKPITRVLDIQHHFIDQVLETQRKAMNKGGNRDVKQREMMRLLSELKAEGHDDLRAPSPLDPKVRRSQEGSAAHIQP